MVYGDDNRLIASSVYEKGPKDALELNWTEGRRTSIVVLC